MRFFHLADLHIGKSINGYSMIEEQKNAFRQIVEYIRIEKPTAVLIAGDIYDRAIPSTDAVQVFDEFLTNLSKEGVHTFIVAGNHDSPERLNFANRILSEMKLHIAGSFDGQLNSVTLDDEFGTVNFFLLPFVKPIMVKGYYTDREIENYNDAVKTILESTDLKFNERNVLLAHQFFIMSGNVAERSESEINIVGGLDEIDAGVLTKFDYVALGHLHGNQKVGLEHIRYAGSPLKYSFSECLHNKCVLVVEVKEKGEVNVSALPIKPIHDLREIKGEFEELLVADESVVGNKEDYLRVTLTDTSEIIDPMNKLRTVFPNAMVLHFENLHTDIDLSGVGATVDRIENTSEYELFCQFFIEATGATMTEDQDNIIRDLLSKEVDDETY